MRKCTILAILLALCLPDLSVRAQPPAILGSVQGVLFSAADRKPVSGVNVWVEPVNASVVQWIDKDHTEYIARDPSTGRLPVVRTDTNGSFTIPNVPPGEYHVRFYTPGFILPQNIPNGPSTNPPPAFDQKVTVTPGNVVHVDIPLEPGGVIEGTVTFADGSPAYPAASPTGPVPGMSVDVDFRQSDGSFSRAPGVAHTDPDGHFRIDGLPPASYVVFTPMGGESVATLRGSLGTNGPSIFYGGTTRASRATVVTIIGSETHSHIDIVLATAGFHAIRGKVERPDGTPATEGRVLLTPAGQKGPPGGQFTFVRADGTFIIPQVPSDTYNVSIQFEPQAQFLGITPDGQGVHMKLTKPTFTAPDQQVTVADHDPAPLVFRLAAETQ